jgi:hypothetical protein
MRRFRHFTDDEIAALSRWSPTGPISTRLVMEAITERELRYLFKTCGQQDGGHDMQVVAAGGPHGVTLRECMRCGFGKVDERDFSLMFPVDTGPSY